MPLDQLTLKLAVLKSSAQCKPNKFIKCYLCFYNRYGPKESVRREEFATSVSLLCVRLFTGS